LSQARIDAAGLVYTIDLGALARNWSELAARCRPAECSAVVKADAYGLGIEAAVPALWAVGCRTFFVAVPQEGFRVRQAAPDSTIYVLNSFASAWGEVCRKHALRPVLGSFPAIEAWAKHAPGEPSAIQVDTGMNRLGLSLHEALELARRPALLNTASPRLIMSHFVCADEPGHPMNQSQLALFSEIRKEFPQLAASLANSAGIHLGADAHFDLVRPGIALYGAEFIRNKPPLSTVVTAEARIMQVHDAARGDTIGYSAGKRLAEDARIAILSAGYADGYHRLAGSSDVRNGASVSVRGRTARIMGRISMDLIAVDVTGIPGAAEGDWAELFGASVPIDAAARAADTVGYEFLVQLSRRAERVYVTGNSLPVGDGVAEGEG
jgi:alanine racemase